MTTVTMQHIRAAGMCSRGARAFFKSAGLDWDAFLAEGIPAEKLAATNDAMALSVVSFAEKEALSGEV